MPLCFFSCSELSLLEQKCIFFICSGTCCPKADLGVRKGDPDNLLNSPTITHVSATFTFHGGGLWVPHSRVRGVGLGKNICNLYCGAKIKPLFSSISWSCLALSRPEADLAVCAQCSSTRSILAH